MSILMTADGTYPRRPPEKPVQGVSDVAGSSAAKGSDLMQQAAFLEVVALAERLHRQFLEFIQLELDKMQLADINNIRAMIVLNIGKDTMTASELLWNGCYLGSNVSYNLKKLTEMGYVEQNRCAYDKRVIMVSNSDKGADLCAALNERVATRLAVLSETGLKTDDIGAARGSLRALQQFCALAAGSRGAGQGERMDVETPATRPGLAA